MDQITLHWTAQSSAPFASMPRPIGGLMVTITPRKKIVEHNGVSVLMRPARGETDNNGVLATMPLATEGIKIPDVDVIWDVNVSGSQHVTAFTFPIHPFGKGADQLLAELETLPTKPEDSELGLWLDIAADVLDSREAAEKAIAEVNEADKRAAKALSEASEAGKRAAKALAEAEAAIERAANTKGKPGDKGPKGQPGDPGKPANRLEFQTYTNSTAKSGAPSITQLKLSGNVIVPPNTSTVLSWYLKNSDTMRMHASGPGLSSRVTTQEEGWYKLSASVNFARMDGLMTMFIRKNGALSLGRSGPVRSGDANANIVHSCTTPYVYLEKGDYVEVTIQHTRTVDATIDSGYATYFEAEYVGPPAGPRVNLGVSFDSSFPWAGLTYYKDNQPTINANRMFSIPDPTGRMRTVMQFSCRKEDNQLLYPRVQAGTPSIYGENSEFWVGLGVYVPSSGYEPIDGDHVMLHEIYGPPFNAAGPNAFRLMNDSFTLHVDALGNQLGEKSWETPILYDQFVDFAFHYKMSKNASVGFVELYMNSGSGWVQQQVKGQLKPYYATMTEANNGGNNYSTIKVSYAQHSVREIVNVIYSSHKVGSSLSAVDPKNYL